MPTRIDLLSLSSVPLGQRLRLGSLTTKISSSFQISTALGVSLCRHVSIDQDWSRQERFIMILRATSLVPRMESSSPNRMWFQLSVGGNFSGFGPRTLIKDGIIAGSVYAFGSPSKTVHLGDATDGTLRAQMPTLLRFIHSVVLSILTPGSSRSARIKMHHNGDFSGSVDLYDINTG